MNSSGSEFYPPRSRGWGRLRLLSFAVRGIFYASPWEIPQGTGRTLLGCIVPGYSFRTSGWPTVARIIGIVYTLLAIIYIGALGFWLSGASLGLMIALHTISMIVAFRTLTDEKELAARVRFALLALLLAGLMYFVAQSFIGRVITPLRYDGKVYVVNGLTSAKDVKKGQTVAYHMNGTQQTFETAEAHGVVWVQSGYGFGKVLGVPGDRIEFTKKALLVNGVAHPRQARMPEQGERIVPEKQWFIWPEFAITVRGDAAGIQANVLVSRMGMVDQQDFRGEVFRHWFWRKQL